ncbi:MAG: hypothetical protein WBB82_11000 [Limnothrix sp.]
MAFIAMGILYWPSRIRDCQRAESVAHLAEFGIALLLCVVGLKLEPNEINAVGSVATFTGISKLRHLVSDTSLAKLAV